MNDWHCELSNFRRVLQRPESFEAVCRTLDAVPFSEVEWQEADPHSTSEPVEKTVRFFVRCRQSLAGRMACFSPLSRVRTGTG